MPKILLAIQEHPGNPALYPSVVPHKLVYIDWAACIIANFSLVAVIFRRMSSPFACQTYRLALALCAARKLMMASESSPSEAKLFSVMKSVRSRKKRSTKFSHDEDVGVKCMWKRGCLASHALTLACLCVA